jgi:hypothetical protein
MVQQMNRANAELQQKLSRMRGKVPAEPTAVSTPAPQLGVSVATDKVEPDTPSSPIDIGARQKLDQLSKAVVGSIMSLQNKEASQGLTPAEQQRLEKLETQYNKLAKQVKRSGMDIPDQFARTAQNDAYAQVSANAMHEERTNGLEEDQSIPLKSVVQGYTVEYNPRTRQVTVSRSGQVIGTGFNRLNSPKYHLTLINKIIDRAEEDKYPTDIDVRDVALPMKAEGSVFGQQDFDTQMDLAKLKSQLTQPKPAQSAPASAEPQPVPARLSDLQSKKQRIDNLASIKQDIEKLQARATRGGRMLPRGLAADLEDYFTVADIDTAYDDMMAKYQKQLGALQQYLGMRKALWTPKKDVHEMRVKELQEGGPETWTVHFTDGTTTRVRVPSDETDPAQVRAFFAKKGKTVKKFDYGFTTEPEAGPGPEPHEPGSGSARSARTGDELKEGRAGYNPLTSQQHWYEVERYLSGMINDRTLDPETRAEARQRYLEKRKEAQQKGWAK